MSRLGLTTYDLGRAINEGSCTWHEDDDGHWHTDCKQMHTFFDGGPVENFYKYCPYCGKFMAIEKYKLEDV